eukprot:13672846-Alexandrium_andersonii.AAC.1
MPTAWQAPSCRCVATPGEDNNDKPPTQSQAANDTSARNTDTIGHADIGGCTNRPLCCTQRRECAYSLQLLLGIPRATLRHPTKSR